jgi:hypothetical protein
MFKLMFRTSQNEKSFEVSQRRANLSINAFSPDRYANTAESEMLSFLGSFQGALASINYLRL